MRLNATTEKMSAKIDPPKIPRTKAAIAKPSKLAVAATVGT
jgi:hypothetical protein